MSVLAQRLDGSTCHLVRTSPRRHCVRWGPSSPSPKRGRAPLIFARCLLTAEWIKMPLGMEVGPGHIVPDGHPAPLPKKGAQPQFSAQVCCGQTAGWIKMPLGTMVGLGPGNIVLDAYPDPPPRGTAPKFRPMSVVAKRLEGSRCHLVRR